MGALSRAWFGAGQLLREVLLSQGREKEDFMIFICFLVAGIAVPIFMLVSGDNRKRKRQNPIPYTTTDEPKKGRATGLD